LKVHRVNDDRLKYIQQSDYCLTSVFDFEMTIWILKKYKSPDTDQIPEEFIKAGAIKFRSEIPKPINSIWNKDKLPQQCKESAIVPIYMKDEKQTIGIIWSFILHLSNIWEKIVLGFISYFK
jgi:hypothetical protein